MVNMMKWASALSTRPSLEAAIEEVTEQAQQLLQAPADLGLIFISAAFASEYSRLLPLLQAHLSIPVLIGCSGGGVIGALPSGQAQEIEDDAALSLTLAQLPGVQVHPFHISTEQLPDLDAPPDAWIDLVKVSPREQPQFVLLADPASSGINEVLQGLDFAYPDSVKVGGMASINPISGHSGLFCNQQRYQDGVVGIALSGNIVLDAIVAQGCRPIGQSYRVVEGERNILMQLEEQTEELVTCGAIRTPLEVLQALFQDLNEDDRLLAQRSLFIGIAQSAFKQTLGQGDFLIRNLLGVDPRTGAIAIGDRVRPGQRVQFHLRDAKASAEDLETLLANYHNQSQTPSPIGALMFSCMGRGVGLYNQPNFDSLLFNQYVPVPVSGFFCNGEIGPVGGTTFLHGYTSVFGICRPRE
ncbi:MAG: FIST C-terminal domain-containing protein [Elainellaceae cyanobacterium]